MDSDHKNTKGLDFSMHDLGKHIFLIGFSHVDTRTNLALWHLYEDYKKHTRALTYVTQGGKRPVLFGQKEVLELRFFFAEFLKTSNEPTIEAFRKYAKRYISGIRDLLVG